MFKLFRKFRNNNSGATAVEYGLIGGLICVSVIVGASQIGNTLGNTFQLLADTIVEANEKD